jgi:hypothetical protein
LIKKNTIGKTATKKTIKELFEVPKNLSGYCLQILEASFGLCKLRKYLTSGAIIMIFPPKSTFEKRFELSKGLDFDGL